MVSKQCLYLPNWAAESPTNQPSESCTLTLFLMAVHGNIFCSSHFYPSLPLFPKGSIPTPPQTPLGFICCILSHRRESCREVRLFPHTFSTSRFLIFITVSRNETDISAQLNPAGCGENISSSAKNLPPPPPPRCLLI